MKELTLNSEDLIDFLEETINCNPLTNIEAFISQSKTLSDRYVNDVAFTIAGFWSQSKTRIQWQEYLKKSYKKLINIRVIEIINALNLAIRVKGKILQNEELQIVWTGPKSDEFPFRNTEQAYLEVIGKSKNRLILVSFAVYHQNQITSALQQAIDRGVSIQMIAESEEKLNTKVWNEIGISGNLISYYYWPLANRSADNKTIPSLHAKTAIADGEIAFVTSANLTEYAMIKNMELGLLVNGGNVPSSLDAHFLSLINMGELVKL